MSQESKLDNPQAVVESPRAEGDECTRAEGDESPRAEGAEPADSGDSGPQAVVEGPRAEGDECPRAEGAESPRAEGAEPAEAGDSGPQVCDTGQIRNGCLREEEVRRRREEEEEEEEKKNVLLCGNGPIPRPPWNWRRIVSNRMRAWSWQWGRIWSWPRRRMWSWPWRRMGPRKKDPGEADTLGTDHSIIAGRVWSVCSTWWTQLWRRRWSASRPTQPESLLPEEGHSEPGQDKGLEAAKLYPRAEKEGAVGGGLDTGTNYCPGGSHMLHRSQYGSDELLYIYVFP